MRDPKVPVRTLIVQIPDELHRRLRKQAFVEEVSQKSLVIRALDAFLAKEKED